MTRPTDTIKALRDALEEIASDPMINAAGAARQALALIADASEDAPDAVLMERQYLAGYDAGFMAGERGDGEARTRVHAFRDREIAAAIAVRPAPVAATPAPDLDDALSAVLWLYHRLPRVYDQQAHIERVITDLAQATGSNSETLLSELGRAAAPAAPIAEVTASTNTNGASK